MSDDSQKNMRNFVTIFSRIVMNDTALERASKRDLAVIEGMLLVILDSVTAELKRRDREEAAGGRARYPLTS